MRVQLSAFGLVAAMVLTAGCGGSGKAGSTGGSTGATSSTVATTTAETSNAGAPAGDGGGRRLSASQLVTQADSICKRLSVELDSPKDTAHSKQDVARVAAQRAGAEQQTVVELSKLTPPASMLSDYQQILAVRRTLVSIITKLGDDVVTNNLQDERRLYASSASLVRQMAATAEHDGFKYCGQLG